MQKERREIMIIFQGVQRVLHSIFFHFLRSLSFRQLFYQYWMPAFKEKLSL
jgi:hypothetical protein